MPEVQPADLTDPRWRILRVSRINLAVSVGGALLAFPLLAWVPGLPLAARLALGAAFAVTLALDLSLILMKAPGSAVAFQLVALDPDARGNTLGVRIRRADGRELSGRVARRSFVSPWFTALRYEADGAGWWPKVVPVWPDSLPAEDFRALRVALKWT